MKSWPLKLSGIFNILLGILIAGVSVVMLTEDTDATAKTGDEIWIAIGVALLVVGIGIMLGQSWARFLGILVSLIFTAIAGLFVANTGFEFRGGKEELKLMLVIVLGLTQLFEVAVLIFGWKKSQKTL
ncbi:MAG TPA: hypothetical protein VFC63_03675 [Blastocatellia bacterium]|nr:hypothetical protein [Blastocatellia bacterium]